MTNSRGKEEKTVEYYDKNSKEWVSGHGGIGAGSYWKEEITKYQKYLPSGKVIEFGSGAGAEAEELISRGYEYVGVDASEGLLKMAKKRNPQADLRKMELYELDFPKNEFDGFWTAATLLHIPKEKIDSVLTDIKEIIKPGGIGFISIKQGNGEAEDKETGRWWSFYTQNEFQALLTKNGYEVLEKNIRPTEGETTWLVYYVKST